MVTKIRIHTESTGWIPAEINDTSNPETANKIISALPITASIQLWGDEIYFSIPVSISEENTQVEVEIGDIAYWPPGSSFCVFFGQTPASRSNKPAAASAVNVFGQITGDAGVFRNVKNGEIITIQLANA